MKFNFLKSDKEYRMYFEKINGNFIEKIEEISEKINIEESELVKIIYKYNGHIRGFFDICGDCYHNFYFISIDDLNNFLTEIDPIIIMAKLTE